jgi:hypothetical protein
MIDMVDYKREVPQTTLCYELIRDGYSDADQYTSLQHAIEAKKERGGEIWRVYAMYGILRAIKLNL